MRVSGLEFRVQGSGFGQRLEFDTFRAPDARHQSGHQIQKRLVDLPPEKMLEGGVRIHPKMNVCTADTGYSMWHNA